MNNDLDPIKELEGNLNKLFVCQNEASEHALL